MSRLRVLLLFTLLVVGCQMQNEGLPVEPVMTAVPSLEASPAATPTLAATLPAPTATAVPATLPPATSVIPTDLSSLITTVQATVPAGAYDDIRAVPLYWPQDERPLFAAYSVGFRSYDLTPLPEHFVAIYTYASGEWVELARQSLMGELSPDILPEQGVTQVDLEPGHIWLAVDGIVGAHSGTFHLLQFDGSTLQMPVSASSASPGIGYLEDLNGDGTAELVLRQHEHYIFCYACGVRYLYFRVFTWDETGQQLQEVAIQPLPASEQNNPAYTAVNRAVELAQAGLWADALTEIMTVNTTAAGSAVLLNNPTAAWDMALINFYVQAWEAELSHTPYPLLTQIFFGDYQAALSLARSYTNDQIFAAPSVLITGTVAEGFEWWLAEYINTQANAALAVRPDLAAAYYFRAWATYLQNPTSPQIAVDMAQAAALDSLEPMFTAVIAPPPATRITFAPGAISATISGEVAAHASKDYVLRALEGQTMQVVITSPTNDVLLTVVGADGIPLTNGLMSGASSWTGTLPATQDYVLRAIGTFDATTYVLTVTIE